MTPDFKNLFAQMAQAPTRVKVAVAGCVLALVAVVSLGGMVAGQPHFVTLYSGLDDLERVAVEKALAEGTVRYRVSQPPGPYAVYVDDSQYDEAQIVVALAEALKRSPSGINAKESGASTIFMSSGERQQTMLKREWQETEHLLQELDFVTRATVTTSMPDPTPLRRQKPLTVSVALTLRGTAGLSREQAENVAKLVRFRFGVPPENVVISDQAGHTLYDPTDGNGARDTRRLFEQTATYDRDLAAKVNEALEQAYGARRALVTVTSEWDHDQSTTLSESIDGEPVALSTEKTETKTPQGAVPSVGGAAGTASNVANGFGTDNAAPGDPSAQGGGAKGEVASTLEQKTVFDASKSRTQTVRDAPRLKRLFISLVVDDSLAAKREEIEGLVKAAVGFDTGRQDVIGVSTTTFAVQTGPVDENGNPIPPEAVDEGPSPTMQMLLERGVEIVAALGFVVLLLSGLKGGKSKGKNTARGRAALAGGGDVGDGTGPDPEALARAQIEELVRSDPRRVGEILSRWADDKSTVGAK